MFINKLSILFVKCFLYFYVWEFGGKSDSILLVFRYLLSPNQWGPDKVNSDKRHDSDKATWLWDKDNDLQHIQVEEIVFYKQVKLSMSISSLYSHVTLCKAIN